MPRSKQSGADATYAETLGLPTDELWRLKADLRSHIPGDPTFMAAVSRVLTHLIDLNLAHPERVKADQTWAEQQAEERAAAEQRALDERHAAEVEGLPEDHPDRAAIEERQAAERKRLDLQRRLAALDAQQKAERDEFLAGQQAARNEALAEAQPAA